jgi:hypothetical protein
LSALLVGAALLAGCGGGSSSSTTDEPTTPAASAGNPRQAAVWARRAEAVCRQASAEATAISANLAEAIAKSKSQPEGINEGLVKPGVAILERESRRLHALRSPPESTDVERFVGLFEPVVVLAHARAAAGEEANLEAQRELEQLIVGLTAEQTAFARRADLKACETGFFEALGGAQ